MCHKIDIVTLVRTKSFLSCIGGNYLYNLYRTHTTNDTRFIDGYKMIPTHIVV